MTDTASGIAELPRTFEALKATGKPAVKCQACRVRAAVATVSVSLSHVGPERGQIAQLRRVPVCEPCGSQVIGMNRKALKA